MNLASSGPPDINPKTVICIPVSLGVAWWVGYPRRRT